MPPATASAVVPMFVKKLLSAWLAVAAARAMRSRSAVDAAGVPEAGTDPDVSCSDALCKLFRVAAIPHDRMA